MGVKIMYKLLGCLLLSATQNNNMNKKIAKSDYNPFNTVKSDKWHREHAQEGK